MILANYSGPRDEATADDIHMRGRTAVYCTDSKIILHDISHIFRGSALWVHAKCAVKTRNRRLMYKRIYNHLFGRKLLGNCNAACVTKIGCLEHYGEKKSINWDKYTNLHVDQHNINATLTDHGFNDWSEAHKVIYLIKGIKTNLGDTCLANIREAVAICDYFVSAARHVAEFIVIMRSHNPSRNHNIKGVYTD